MPKYFREEVQKLGFAPISQPKITDFHFEDGEPLRFKAVFEVMPNVEVAPYSDLKAEKGDVSVNEDEIERELQALRENQATYNPVDEDRGLQDGDFAQASFTGTPIEKQESGLVDSSGNPVSSGQQEVKSTGSQPVHMDDVLVDIGGACGPDDEQLERGGAKAHGEIRSGRIQEACLDRLAWDGSGEPRGERSDFPQEPAWEKSHSPLGRWRAGKLGAGATVWRIPA